jgi:uncharacterized damage-inducible protein DinB
MIALSDKELVAWVEQTTTGWRGLIAQHPQILDLPCDVRESKSVAELLRHIVAVELRYSERLHNLRETPYDSISFGSSTEIFATHDRAMAMLREVREQPEFDWEQELDFTTRSAGALRASRRTIFVHLLMHSIRHYAQLATLVRQHGIKPGWQMDYLLMGVKQP